MSTAISRDGTTIDYDRYGDGPTVIFIGGATQHRALDATGGSTARLLGSHHFTAIDYDRRGRGRSGDTLPWSTAREVEDLDALIQANGGTAALCTSSSGATIALAAAAAQIGVSAMALYEPPLFPGADGSAKLAALSELLAAGDNDAAMRYNLRDVIGLPPEAVEGMARSPWWPTMVAVAPTLRYDLSAVHEISTDPDWRSRWAGITIPVTVLSGDQTFPGMPEAADAVAAALPKATRRILPGQGHGPSAEALIPVLVEFLTESASGSVTK